MFRSIDLPADVPGSLYLHSMPGMFEKFSEFLAEAARTWLDQVICLVSEDEILRKSPAYGEALSMGRFPIERVAFPIRDYGVPGEGERQRFLDLATGAAAGLNAGQSLLVHCASGVGRTGTFSLCVLAALGLDCAEAIKKLSNAGAGPETMEQMNLVKYFFGLNGKDITQLHALYTSVCMD